MEQRLINKLKRFFALQPIEKAWIFGSYSRGEETHHSDVDILVRFDRNETITLFKYVNLLDALQQLLRRKVDLVEEGQIKEFAKDSVEQSKILIYEREAER
jgi:predicted nucleotidyltransferase